MPSLCSSWRPLWRTCASSMRQRPSWAPRPLPDWGFSRLARLWRWCAAACTWLRDGWLRRARRQRLLWLTRRPLARTPTPRPRGASLPSSSCGGVTPRRRLGTSAAVRSAARSSRTFTLALKAAWPKRWLLRPAVALPRLSAVSLPSAPIFPAGQGPCWEIRHLPRGWRAPHWPQETRSWPLLLPMLPRRWQPLTRSSGRIPRPPHMPWAWSIVIRPAWPAPRQSTRTRGPGRRQQRTLASCTNGKVTGIRPSIA